ncbi:hypothetical protein Ancab_013210 [Ancistrocladus abbreviatus]
MTFVVNDPLSELVWSPHKGLSLRCAAGAVSEKNPSRVWGVRPRTMFFSSIPSSTAGTNGGKLVKKGDLIATPTLAAFPVKDDVSDNYISPSTVESFAGTAQAGCPVLGHDSGFCGKVEDNQITVDAQNMNQDTEDLGKEVHSSGRKIRISTVTGARDAKLSFSPGLEKGKVVEDISKFIECDPNVAPVTLMRGNGSDVKLCGSIGQNGESGNGHQMLPMKAELRASNECQAPDSLILNLPSLGKRQQEADTIMKEASGNKTPLLASNSVLPVENVESTAENDFWPLCKVVSDSAVDFQKGFQKEEKLHLDICAASKASPLIAYECKRKGKEKVVSDGDAEGRTSKDVDDSHESAESCNSVAFLNARKKRIFRSEQQLVGIKRVKQQTQEHPGSTSFNKIDSSFMNWISNMIKGSPKPAQDNEPSFALVLAKPENGNENQRLTKCSRNQDHRWNNMGFHPFFESLYRPNQKVQDRKMLQVDNQTGEGHEQLELTKNLQYLNGGSVTCRADDPEPVKCNLLLAARANQSMLEDVEVTSTHIQTPDENDAIFQLDYQANGHPHKQASDGAKERGSSHSSTLVKQKTNSRNNMQLDSGTDNPDPGKSNLLPAAGINHSVLEHGEGQLAHGKTSDENVDTCQVDYQTQSANRYSSKQESDVLKEGQTIHNSSLGKWKTYTGNNASGFQFESKVGYSLVNKSDLLSSLWVTRFCPKTSGSMVNQSHGKQSSGGIVECSQACNNHCSKVDESLGPWEYPSEGPSSDVGKELQNCATGNEAGCSLKGIEGHKTDLIVPSPRFKSSEALASVLAKRLDALKQMLPSDLTDKMVELPITCFFCGVRGHDLKECSQVTGSELEELLRNVSTYGEAEESPCLCIRCFQLNHWAVSCPNTSSRKQHGLGNSAAAHNDCICSEMQSDRRFERIVKLEHFESQTHLVREHAADLNTISCKCHRLSTNLDLEMNAVSSSPKLISLKNRSLVDEVTGADYGVGISEVPKFTYPCNAVSGHISDVRKGIFDAVKKLRLSRTDVLKWMNSSVSFSHLDGYYLRVRLGEWEGLGGTGYYVACIIGVQGERLTETLRKPICVDVGGIRCSIGSQYVSNQDFLEDELMVWWSATAKAGGKIPCEADLRTKVEERIRLGL